MLKALQAHPEVQKAAQLSDVAQLPHPETELGIYALEATTAATLEATPPAASLEATAAAGEASGISKPQPKKRPPETSVTTGGGASGISKPQPKKRPLETSSVASAKATDKVSVVLRAKKKTEIPELPPWRREPQPEVPAEQPFDEQQLSRASHALSWILRHGAHSLNMEITPSGFVRLADLQIRHPFIGLSTDDFATLCLADSKQRFLLQADESGNECIAAYTGHSMSGVHGPAVLVTPPKILIHGSYLKHKASIERSGLLSSQRATHLMDPSRPHHKWRRDLTMKVVVDTQAACRAGCVFRQAGNGVWICTEAIPPDAIQECSRWELD